MKHDPLKVLAEYDEHCRTVLGDPRTRDRRYISDVLAECLREVLSGPLPLACDNCASTKWECAGCANVVETVEPTCQK